MATLEIEERIERAFFCDQDAQAAVFMVMVKRVKQLLQRSTISRHSTYLGLTAEDFQKRGATVDSLLLKSRIGPDILTWLKR